MCATSPQLGQPVFEKKILSSPKDIFLLVLEGEEGSEEERKKSQSREKD